MFFQSSWWRCSQVKKRKSFYLVVLVFLTVLLTALGGCTYVTGEVPEAGFSVHIAQGFLLKVSPVAAYAIVALNAGHADFTVIDVRTPAEYAVGHLPGALNRDLSSPTFKDDIDQLEKDKTYLVYCASGVRSTAAAKVMQESGFQRIYNMDGGITAWKAQNLPVVK
jgi:rhodanese-related sulfurtransferase